MERKIELTKTGGRFVNADGITITKEDGLQLVFESVYNLTDTAVITIRNGAKSIRREIKQPFEVPQDVLFAGWLFIRIDLYLDGEIAKTWQLLPVRLTEAADEIHGEEYVNIIERLERRVEEAEKKLDEEIAIKTELLAQFKDFADNGVNVQFDDEEETQGE